MTARKTRPAFRTPITPDMSQRDIASALGISSAELHRWTTLAAVPVDEFERSIDLHHRYRKPLTAASIIAMHTPVPARGRVERAAAIFKSMTPDERGEFLARVGLDRMLEAAS